MVTTDLVCLIARLRVSCQASKNGKWTWHIIHIPSLTWLTNWLLIRRHVFSANLVYPQQDCSIGLSTYCVTLGWPSVIESFEIIRNNIIKFIKRNECVITCKICQEVTHSSLQPSMVLPEISLVLLWIILLVFLDIQHYCLKPKEDSCELYETFFF